MAAHIGCLVAAGDLFQKLRGERPGDCGSAVDWLKANAVSHEQTEQWRYGPAVLSLLALERSQDFTGMGRSARCAIPGGSVWRCQELFAFIFALTLEAAQRGSSRVAVITNYDRVRVALQAFVARVRENYADQMPESLEVLTPEEASGSNVQATIVLGGHRRNLGDTVWHGGQAQPKRRDVALSRASHLLNILVAAPRQDGSGHNYADDYWVRVVRHCQAPWRDLVVAERVMDLGWDEGDARQFARAVERAVAEASAIALRRQPGASSRVPDTWRQRPKGSSGALVAKCQRKPTRTHACCR